MKSTRHQGFSVWKKAARSMRWVPSYAWQYVSRPSPRGDSHLIISLADHFEPAIMPLQGAARASYHEQEKRLDHWCRTYPRAFDGLRDSDGRAFTHTYFYPAEQYDPGLLARLAAHCHAGWGEVEIHLHHGLHHPDTEGNTRRQLLDFRNALANEHGCLSYLDGMGSPRYAFVHGNFALANSAGGRNCGVDSEMQVLADTGCYADFTLPPGLYHLAHTSKINSLYECFPPLARRGSHRRGRDLSVGHNPTVFPVMIQGPLMMSFVKADGKRRIGVENGALTHNNPPSLYRLGLWRNAGIRVKRRPNWLFIKLQCHGMDPRDEEIMLGASATNFLQRLLATARERSETVHFVTAREQVNIILAACEGREGDPGQYRDYRLKRLSTGVTPTRRVEWAAAAWKN